MRNWNLFAGDPTSCLASIQSLEAPAFQPRDALGPQFTPADRCFETSELDQALVHTIVSLIWAREVSDDSRVAVSLQRLGDLFLVTEKDFMSAQACYETTMYIIGYTGVRRHIADCLLWFSVVLLLEGKITDAKRNL